VAPGLEPVAGRQTAEWTSRALVLAVLPAVERAGQQARPARSQADPAAGGLMAVCLPRLLAWLAHPLGAQPGRRARTGVDPVARLKAAGPL
jgi:hypothetical protein